MARPKLTDIHRNPHPYRLQALCLGAMSIFPLFIGLQPLTFLPRDQWGWAIIPVGIAMVLITLGVLMWRRSGKAGVAITFHPGGFLFEQNPMIGRAQAFDLAWNDIREVAHAHMGYASQWGEFLLTHEAALRIGMVRETTRENALLVDRRIRFTGHLMDVSRQEMVERLRVAAAHDGFELERIPGRFGFVSRDRWAVVARS